MRHIKLVILFLLVAVIPAFAGRINNAEDLISEMHKKYSGKWYKTLTFVQKNTSYRRDGTTQNSVWHEAMSLPGKLRVDFVPLEKGNGWLFTKSEQHSFKDGKLARSAPMIHPLMVLGFDVYGQTAEKTIKQLKELKFDLSVMHTDTWQGRAVYVVGAKKGDSHTLQFWIDKKRLLLVRILQPAGPGGKFTSETQFNKYQKVKGGGWISPEVVFLFEGKKRFVEEYTEMRFNVDLNEDLFDPKKWAEVDKNYYKKVRN